MKMIFNYRYDAHKTHFHNKGFALSLILKVRFFGTRKWPISYFTLGTSVDIPLPITYVTVLDIFKLWHFITKTEISTIRYEIKSSHYNPNLPYNIVLTVTRYSVCLCPSSPFPTQQLFSVKLGRVLKL